MKRTAPLLTSTTGSPRSARLRGIIAGMLLANTLNAATATHQCYYHAYYYNQTFGDILNIYGCVYGDFSRYLNVYEVQGLTGGVPVRVVVTPAFTNGNRLLDDIQIVWYPITANSNALAFSPIVKTNVTSPFPVVLDYTPPVSGQYALYVSTTTNQNWDYNTGMLGVYNILITQIIVPDPTPQPTPVRGRDTPTPGPPAATATPTPVRGRETPTQTPTPTPTPTPDDSRRPRTVLFR